ncbi:MAG: quinol:cytochrome C oxidoreductase, partial [Bacteroidota bacterium]|nr:quinol:cytochrome C oxidoreductase [Bacteroidota bacterium]
LGLILLIFIAGRMGLHHIYHWQDQEVYEVGNKHFDEVLKHKQPYFADLFFWGRTVVFFLGWWWYQMWSRKNALAEDTMRTSVETARNWNLNLKNAAIFLVFFGFTSSVFSWDAVMSIDVHWYSTLFGWYNFAGWWLGAIIVANLLVMHLKSRGQMEYATPSHVHDLGKWMFAISFLWTYLWFSQFMLIWYSNIPEEVVYFQQRWEQFRGLFWITMLVNFAFPMLILMSRDAKRNKSHLLFVALLIVFFHWTDTFLLVMPGAVGSHWGIGAIEIGMFLSFVAFFTFWILRSLSKAPLLAKNHALLEEGLHFHA